MLMAITLFSFAAIFSLLYLLFSAYFAGNGQMATRLKTLENLTASQYSLDDELAQPFQQRVLAPFTRSIADMAARFAPHSLRLMAERRLAAAGGFGRLTANEFILLFGALLLVLPVLIMVFGMLSGLPGQKAIGFGMLSAALIMAMPILILARKAAHRRRSIQRDLPDVLDLLTVSVEAGLGFDGALAKLAEKMKGVLVEEFSRMLQELRMGMPRREALRSLGDRCGVPDLALFATAVIQADQLGVSIGNVLRVQSAALRSKRRQRAEEQAMKAQVKMMLPMVLFIFPTVFIVILGPAVIRFLEAMGK